MLTVKNTIVISIHFHVLKLLKKYIFVQDLYSLKEKIKSEYPVNMHMYTIYLL